ncbi:MAG: carbohydrate kinase family protein [Bacteroidales bacterium]|nr:carbohydrate kinase family protein [Bacteroidales bacterium]
MLNFDPSRLCYDGIVGTGGIGSGKFFMLKGNHTLGREESRAGHFLNINDYCKQHIILHYIKVLLGQSFRVIPAGKTGDDDIGCTLFREMEETGFEMDLVEKVNSVSTLFSFCFQYPDGSGGNLTTDNSACSMVDTDFIEKAKPSVTALGSKGIVMAAPEVPLPSRQRLLELGRMHGLFCAASFTTGELEKSFEEIDFGNIDLLAINADEASAIAGSDSVGRDKLSLIKAVISRLQSVNGGIVITITDGREGSWCWDGMELNRIPSIEVTPVSTAGAGDAFFSGILTGLALGLHLFEAQQLATLIAGLSVCSPDTIHKGIDKISILTFLKQSKMTVSPNILKLLED